MPPVVTTLKLKLPSAIAEQFGVSLSAVRKAMATGRLPYFHANGATRPISLIDPDDAARLWSDTTAGEGR